MAVILLHIVVVQSIVIYEVEGFAALNLSFFWESSA